MADPHVISALKRKYGELAGELRATQIKIEALKADMAQVKATMRLFRDDVDADAIPPIRPYAGPRWFGGGLCAKTTLDVLRTADRPMTTREIALRVAQLCEIEDIDAKSFKAIRNAVQDVLRRRAGSVVVLHEEFPRRWSVATMASSPD